MYNLLVCLITRAFAHKCLSFAARFQIVFGPKGLVAKIFATISAGTQGGLLGVCGGYGCIY